MINVLILDDERRNREMLEGMLKSYCSGIGDVYQSENTSEARTKLSTHKIDLVFLDIEMPGESGLAFLSTFDKIPFEVIITTAYKKYAIEAFRFGACDYLLKPYERERLVKAFSRISVTKKPESKTQALINKISIPTLEGYSIVKTEDIEFLKAEGNYTKIHFKDKSHTLVSKNLKRFEDQLVNNNFVRIHRSSIVNVNYIVKYVKAKSPSVILESGLYLEVSPGKRQEIINLLNII